MAQYLGHFKMSYSRRQQLWHLDTKDTKSIIYWTHKCSGVNLSTPDGKVCPNCGISEEEHGRLKSKGGERRVSST